jgi:hypothetical protein
VVTGPTLAMLAAAGDGHIKAAALQSLGVKRHAETVMPKDLDQITASATKHKQITGMGIALLGGDWIRTSSTRAR